MVTKYLFSYNEKCFDEFVKRNAYIMFLLTLVIFSILDITAINYELLKNYLGKADDIKDIANILLCVNATIIVYYGLIPKINSDILMDILMEIKALHAGNLLEAKYLYDKYRKAYTDIEKNHNLLNRVRLLNYITMILLICILHAWQYSKGVTLGLSIFFTIIILGIVVVIGLITDNIFIFDLAVYPEPSELLNIRKNFPKTRDLNIKLDENVQLSLLTAGIVIYVVSSTQEEISKDIELSKSTSYKDIKSHISLSVALPFNLHGVEFTIRPNNFFPFKKIIDKYKYNYKRVNPSIEFLFKECEITENTKFILTIRLQDGQIVDLCFERSGEKYIVKNVITHMKYGFPLLKDDEYIIV